MLPNFVIIGAPKAATTWIADGLREHPQVYVPQTKELRYFCGRNLGKGLEWYENHFRKVTDERAVGEASPSYLGSVEAPARIKTNLPEAKLILSLRHPVDQAFSFYWHQMTRGQIRLDTDFASFFSAQRPRASFYGSNLDRYLRSFAREQILILVYEEDIRRSPREGIKKCYEFLDVDPTFSPTVLTTKSNAKREITTFHGTAKLAREYVGMLPANLAQPLKHVGKRVLKLLPEKQEPLSLSPELRREFFREHYAADVERLEQLLERDFSVWYQA